MRRALLLILLFILFYPLALLFTLPARFAWQQLEPRIAAQPLPLQLREIEGTLWQGRIGELSHHGVTLGALEWQITLNRYGPALQLRLLPQQGGVAARLQWHWRGAIEIADLRGELAIAELLTWSPQLLPVATGGLTINIDTLTLDPQTQRFTAAGSGGVVWSRAAITLMNDAPLGSLKASVNDIDDDGWLRFKVEINGGVIEGSGDGRIAVNGSHEVIGKLRALPQAPAALQQSLPLIGSRDREGWVHVNRYGHL
jgi:hypothetical protein